MRDWVVLPFILDDFWSNLVSCDILLVKFVEMCIINILVHGFNCSLNLDMNAVTCQEDVMTQEALFIDKIEEWVI